MKEVSVPSILIALLLLTVGVTAEAQQPKKVYRLGYLSPRLGIDSSAEAFRQGLRELGYIDGQNILMEWRFTKARAIFFLSLRPSWSV